VLDNMIDTIKENNNSKLKEIVGEKNPLVAEVAEKEEEQNKWKSFEAICELQHAARELYCEGEMSWDEMCKNLSDAINKLKGKEKELLEEEEDEDGEDED